MGKDDFTNRRGMTLLEVSVALLVLTVAMVALVQLISLSVRQRRMDDQRSLALQELANEAERLAVLPWSELTAERLGSWQPPAEVSAQLPAAKCQVAVQDEAGPPAARRIDLSLGWINSVGESVTPVELTFWRYSPEAMP